MSDAPAQKVVPGNGAGDAASPLRGILMMLLATFLFTVMDALAKWLSARYSIVQIIFFRSVFSLIPLAVLLFRQGIAPLRTQRLLGHVGRALVGLSALYVFFLSVKLMPIADVYAISFAAPLFVTALSVLILGEHVGVRRWAAVLVGFVGVMVMLEPGTDVFQPLALLPLLGALLYAFVVIIIRALGRTESSAALVFYFLMTAGIVSGVLLPFVWVTPDLAGFALLVCIGIVGGCAQISMTVAFRSAEVSLVVPFEYSAMLWAVLIGYFVWGDVPAARLWIGVAIVVASALYIALRELRLARAAAAPGASATTPAELPPG